MSKKFTLSDGDRVRFVTIAGREAVGTLLKRPYGRRLYAIVRADNGQVNYLPSRDYIKEKC